MPCHWGHREKHIVTQSSPTGSQCLPAVGCAEATRYIQGRNLPGCNAHGDEITYVSLGEGATSEGEFWESLNTACRLHLPVLYIVADNGYAISVRAEDQSPAPISEMVRGFRGLAVTKIDGRDYFQARHFGARAVARVRAGEGPGLVHAKVTRPYSHSAADTQSKYRPAEELADEARHDPILVLEHELREGRRADAPTTSIASVARRRTSSPTAAKQALAAAKPDPATVLDHVYVRPPIPDPPAPPTDGDSVTFGEADPAHAARADGSGRAHPSLRRGRRRRARGRAGRRRRQGRRVRHDARSATHVRHRTVLQHAARGGQHRRARHRPGSSRPAAVPRDPVLRLHLAGHDADQERGRDHPLALERRVVVPGRAAGGDRRLPDRRCDLAQPVRRVDLHACAGPHRHVPVAGA